MCPDQTASNGSQEPWISFKQTYDIRIDFFFFKRDLSDFSVDDKLGYKYRPETPVKKLLHYFK